MSKLGQPGAIKDANNISQTDERAFNVVARRFVTYFSRYGQDEWLDRLNHNEAEIKVQRLAEESCNLVTALNRAIVSGHLEMATRTFMAAAQVLKLQGHPDQVIELAQLILRQNGLHPNGRLRIQMVRAEALRLTGQINRASIATTWILAVAEECNQPKVYADCLVEAAHLRIEEGLQEVAERYLETARKIYSAIGSPRGCAKVLTLLGAALTQHGEYQVPRPLCNVLCILKKKTQIVWEKPTSLCKWEFLRHGKSDTLKPMLIWTRPKSSMTSPATSKVKWRPFLRAANFIKKRSEESLPLKS